MKERSGRRNAKAVSPEMGFNVHNFQSFFVEIDPGKSEGAYHSHSEALKLYIKGRGREIIGGKENMTSKLGIWSLSPPIRGTAARIRLRTSRCAFLP